MSRITLIPCLAAAFIIGACTDDKGAGPVTTTGTPALLAGGKWKMTAHTVSPGVDFDLNGVIVTDLFAVEGGCTHDDITKYTTDGKWSIDEGATKCLPSDPQTESGTWILNSTGDWLSMKSTLDPVALEFKVDEVSATSLRLSTHADWNDGKDHLETTTYTAQ